MRPRTIGKTWQGSVQNKTKQRYIIKFIHCIYLMKCFIDCALTLELCALMLPG